MKTKTTIQVSNKMIIVTNTFPDGSTQQRSIEIRPGVEIPLEAFEEWLVDSKYEARYASAMFLPRTGIIKE